MGSSTASVAKREIIEDMSEPVKLEEPNLTAPQRIPTAPRGVRARLVQAFTPKASISRPAGLSIAVIAFAILIGAWALITYSGMVDPMFVPTPGDTIVMGFQMMQQGFIVDIWATVFRVMSGFIIAAIVALPIGILIGAYAPASSFFQPVFSFIRYLPASAFIPLFILWIGIGEWEKIAIIILGSLPQLVLMIANNIRAVSLAPVEASYTLGTTKANVLWKVILPSAWPNVIDTLRIVLGWAWTYVIVAEIVGASSGIGFSILQAQRTVAIGRIFFAILVLGIIGLIVDYALIFLNRILFPWHTEQKGK